jgi:hypothetical protein
MQIKISCQRPERQEQGKAGPCPALSYEFTAENFIGSFVNLNRFLKLLLWAEQQSTPGQPMSVRPMIKIKSPIGLSFKPPRRYAKGHIY